MELNIEVISREIIKPSSPTPPELRILKLSLLDQIAPPNYTPIIFFYDSVHDPNLYQFEKSDHLKKCLSETLAHFYPLAGTMTEGYSVHCNDEGVDFSEARIRCNLSDVIENPDVKVLHKLLPFEPFANLTEQRSREVIIAIQLNLFDCGGVAIALCVTHKVFDGMSATVFVKAWAATARGDTDEEVIEPNFEAAKYFPPLEALPGLKRRSLVMKDEILTKRFVFDKSNIASLRQLAAVSLDKPPTRVEAVSAFIWSRFMAMGHSDAKVFAAVHAVNLRGKMDPPLPPQACGNLWWFAIALLPTEEEYANLVSPIRNAIKEIDANFVKKLRNADISPELKKMGKHVSGGEVEYCNFTSWCRFPVYEADFGWGKPTWVCSPSRPYKNVVVLITTRDGDGIEAWVTLNEQDMALFETDSELLSFASSSSVKA